MAIQNWSDDIMVAELADDPQFTDELDSLLEKIEGKPTDVVLKFAAVGFVNSSNIAKLLRLRKAIANAGSRLIMCDVNTQVWSIFMVTGLDKIFEFTADISVALTTLQMSGEEGAS
jgi:anti-anti-sigma factor